MKFSLDTNTCIYILNNRFPQVRETLLTKSPAQVIIPSIVAAELFLGAFKSQSRKKMERIVQDFLSPFQILPFGEKEAWHYAEIRVDLEKTGNIIGANDLIVASTVLANGIVLVTNNVKEFGRIPGLRVENWANG